MNKKAKVTLEYNGKSITEEHDGVVIVTFDEIDGKLVVNTIGNVENKVAHAALGDILENETETKVVDDLE